MKKNEEQLLTMGFDEAVPLLAAKVFDVYIRESDDTISEQDISSDRPYSSKSSPKQTEQSYKVNEFVRCVILKILKFGGTDQPPSRDAFQFKITPFMLDSYASEFAEQVKLATSHRREVEELRRENRNLQIHVKELEEQLGAVQQEHVDLVKNVVMAKLAKEEMAEEVR